MFEQVLQAGPTREDRRFASLSIAVGVHLVVIAVVILGSLLVVETVNTRDLLPVVFQLTPAPPLDLGPPPRGPDRAPASGPRADAKKAAEPEPLAQLPEPQSIDLQPQRVPDEPLVELDLATLNPTPGAGRSLDGDRNGPGSGDDRGDGTGGRDPPGTGGPTGDGRDDGPYFVGGGVTAPELLDRVKPRYPESARRGRVEGSVVLRAIIGEDGRIREVTVLRSSSRLFDAAAIEAVQQWRYAPGMRNGIPVPVYLTVVVEFTLQ